MNAIEVTRLKRIFKTHTGVIKRTAKEVRAVEEVSFDIREGELFGLLGPNGAGKTTTVKMLTTLLIPTNGSATVKGFDIVKQADEVRRRIGFIFGGERGLYWREPLRRGPRRLEEAHPVSAGYGRAKWSRR